MDGCVAKNREIALEQTSPLFLFSHSTLIDSTPGVLAAWDRFGREYGFDSEAAARAGHGRRLAETLGELCNLETPEEVEVCPFRVHSAPLLHFRVCGRRTGNSIIRLLIPGFVVFLYKRYKN